jgi:phospholipid/cholesterol/gamma-HCH transport system substrate-binding protein
MATRAQKVRLSIFLMISSVVFFIFFILLVGNRLLKQMDTYYIIYRDISVTGLEPGAAVKLHGVQVGRVVSLSVLDAATIRIEIEVNRHTPIKKDTEAILTLVGITGQKFVELLGGSLESETLPVGGTITAGQSMFESITGRAEIIMAKLEGVLNNLNELTGPKTTESLHKTLSSISNVSTEVDSFLETNRGNLTSSIANLDTVLANISSATDKVDESMEKLNNIITSKEVDKTLSNIVAITGRLKTQLDSLKLVETMNEFRTFAQSSNEMVVHSDLLIMKSRDDILKSMSNLEETLDNLREASEVIRDNPSVLLRGRQAPVAKEE